MIFIATILRQDGKYLDLMTVEEDLPADAREVVFAAYNRGSGSEVQFDGPSFSVGDRIVLEVIEENLTMDFTCEPVDWSWSLHNSV